MNATDFRLQDQDGVIHTLSQYKGKWVILYFYPKDDTPGCTKEACSFRDSTEEFTKRGVVILGVSKDSVASHKKFATKYHLTFPILSDESLEMIKSYNAWGKKKFMGREYDGIFRMTYLINPEGEIEKVYEKVNPLIHSGDILEDLKMRELPSKP
ncbi:MAG: thioredoxin-dependent thiol peroxidase [Patescibacteria group bacterium]